MYKYNIVHIISTTSTNDEVKKYQSNTLLYTDFQTNGRGKTNREWKSENNGNLYMSLILNVKNNKNRNFSQLPFVSSISIVESIISIAKKDINIKNKWPNDVLVNDKKLSGMLLEYDRQNDIL